MKANLEIQFNLVDCLFRNLSQVKLNKLLNEKKFFYKILECNTLGKIDLIILNCIFIDLKDNDVKKFKYLKYEKTEINLKN